ncbi:MAG: DUF1073 domain-containing protein [Patescibacteria group bacterium]|nr:DUF1073 domain-containing protein [Patescibacteria group bacterium]
MNREDVRNLAAATAAKARSLASKAGKAAPAEPAKPARPAKPAAPAQAGPVPFRKRQRPALTVVGGKDTTRPPRFRITDGVLQRARSKRETRVLEDSARNLLRPYQPAPGVLPAGKKVAMDSALPTSVGDWGGGLFAQGGWFDGITFLGYPVLAELAQRAEYRKACERLSTECTKKWIKLVSTGKDDKSDRMTKIDTFLKNIKLREAAQEAVFMDAAMGRAHWYLDTGDTDDPNELKSPIGDGRNKFSLEKVSPEKPLQRIQVLDPTWTYPAMYNASNPLKPDWLSPSSWYSMATEIHSSRMPTFVGRAVPDLFKPAFNFGGLPLTQMMRVFVDNWTQVRQHVARAVANFSKNGILTDMEQMLAPAQGGDSNGPGADDFFRRLDLYTAQSDNNGLMVLNKSTEEFFQFNTPLGTLDALMSQFLEQMLLPSGMPVVVFLGLTPQGLNASSEGEVQAWESWVHAYQPHFFGDKIQRVIDFAQLSIDGQVDPEIGYEWVPLRSMTEKELGELRKADAERDAIYLDRGVLDPIEPRRKLAADPNSGYSGIDAEDVPDPPDDGGGGEEDDGQITDRDSAGKVS